MPEAQERIVRIEEKLAVHDASIEQLKHSIEEQHRTSIEILDKLNRLVYRDEEAKSTYEHHKLQCQVIFDSRYLLKTELKPLIIEMIETLSKKKLDNTKSISYLISSFLNITWKVVIIAGGIIGIVSLLGG